MRIILLRHGKSGVGDVKKITMGELQQWIELYNSSGIEQDCLPSMEAVSIAMECHSVVCSDYLRSIESAKRLGIKKINHIDPVYREMGLPYGNWKTPKMSPLVWASMFRVFWFLGYSANAESLSVARKRAFLAANMLETMAVNAGDVLHVGHGFMNRYIAKALLSKGWQGPGSPGKKHWGFGVYEFNTAL